MLRIHIVTLFPEFFRVPLATSIAGRAAATELVEYDLIDLREFTHDRQRTVDDLPYGGGAGMVLKPEPFWEAVESLAPVGRDRPDGPVVLLSARGRPFRHEDAVRFSLAEELTLLCGHYKDVDQRVADGLASDEISLGPFVLSGGEIAALAVADATVRLLPGAISDHESAATDSFYDEGLSAPSYTRPAEFRGRQVPEVLLSGDHARIVEWRRRKAAELTRSLTERLREREDEG